MNRIYEAGVARARPLRLSRETERRMVAMGRLERLVRALLLALLARRTGTRQ